jgi:hypothetical protein
MPKGQSWRRQSCSTRKLSAASIPPEGFLAHVR